MNYAKIYYADMVNGKGVRVSLFVSGCHHDCAGCFNKEAQNPNYGNPFTEEVENKILDYFEKYDDTLRGLSLLGGEPLYHSNIIPLIKFVNRFRTRFPNKDVWIWSGSTFEEIMQDEYKKKLVSLCNVLVDGKFVLKERNLNLHYRGSNNQRVVDIDRSFKEGKAIDYDYSI